MTEDELKIIVQEIRSQGLNISEKDPVLSILSGHDLLYKRWLQEANILLQNHKTDLVDVTETYLQKAKELAEIKISNAVEDVFIKMDEYKARAIEDLKAETPKAEIPTVFWVLLGMTGVMSIAAGYMVALLILT